MADEHDVGQVEVVEDGGDVEGQAVEGVPAGGGGGPARPPEIDADDTMAPAGQRRRRSGPALVVEAEAGQEDDGPPVTADRPGIGDVEPDAGIDLHGGRRRCPTHGEPGSARSTWNSSRFGSRVMCQYSALVHGIVVTTRPRRLR